MAVVGILMLHTYPTAIAAPPHLRYDDLDFNMTLTSPLTSTANVLPPDPNVIILPSVGRIHCFSYAYSRWKDDIYFLLVSLVPIITRHLDGGQASQKIGYQWSYGAGHALFSIEPSLQLTWYELSLVVGFINKNAEMYTPGTFLFEVSGGRSGNWTGSLTTH